MNAQTWGMACHLSGLAGYVTAFIGNIVGPLLVWIMKKDEISQVDYHGKESLNFNLTVLLYGFLFFIPSILSFGILFFVLYPALIAFHVVFTLIASMKANQGIAYRYPLTIRFVK